jgi:hypothetical protein
LIQEATRNVISEFSKTVNAGFLPMMKLLLISSLFVGSYGFAPKPSAQAAASSTRLCGWFDGVFKPIHGHPGNVREEDLDSMYEDQQKLLKARKDHHIDKGHLHQKYGRKEGFIESLLHPVHGRGSATSSDLDDMWRAQQELMYMRREYGKNHQKLKNKYYQKSHEQLENQRHAENVEWEKRHCKGDPRLLNQKEDEAMYVDDASTNRFLNLKMPWERKLKP